jgi:hypothetical protein
MAQGEIYLKSSDLEFLYFINPSDVEISVQGTLLASAPSEIKGEFYLLLDASDKYLTWSHGPGLTYVKLMTSDSNTTEPNSAVWLANDNIYVAHDGISYRA